MWEADRPDWNDFVEAYDERVDHLRFDRIILPIRFIQDVVGAKALYREAKLAYLFGLPNSSVAASVRCLEVGLRKAFEDHEGKTAQGSLGNLIDWSEGVTDRQTNKAVGSRIPLGEESRSHDKARRRSRCP
ncbi:MAG: hypothetical protein WBC82_01105 [Dehalococcoidia bacterium]